jgi:hypothetical protein
MFGTGTQTPLQAGAWLPAAADELQRLRDDFISTQLHAAPQERPSAIVRQYAEVLPRETPLVASETNALPSTVIERVASNRTGSTTEELQQHDSRTIGRHGMRGPLQVANPDLEEESSTVNERVVSNNFTSLTEELQQIYQSSSFEDDYPQFELPGILRVANPEQGATPAHAHHEYEEEYGDAGDHYDQSEEDGEYMDHLYKLRASAFQLSMSQSRHAQPVPINHHRIFERGLPEWTKKTLRFRLDSVTVNRSRGPWVVAAPNFWSR